MAARFLSGEVLVVAALFADNYVVGQVDLYRPLDEVQVAA